MTRLLARVLIGVLATTGLVAPGTAGASPRAGHELTVLTFSLLYAADFADRLEHQIIPALRAGFIVIADRYMISDVMSDKV